MVRHDWMTRVYQWIGVPGTVLNIIVKPMEGWETRLELNENRKVLMSRKIKIRKRFLQGDSYSPVGFCLMEVLISILIQETDGYTMGQRDKERVKRTSSLFIDNLKIYRESHRNLEAVNEMIVKGSMDAGACYRVKKCAEVVFRKSKIIKGEGLVVLEDKIDALDPKKKHEIYIFLGCKQADKAGVKRVIERVKNEIRKRLNHQTGLNLNDKNLMKAISCQLTPVAGYVMNVCNLGKDDLDKLDIAVKSVLR